MIPPKPISYRRQHHDTPSRELPPFKLRSLKSGTIIRPKREIEQGSTSSSVDGPTAADDLSGEPTDRAPEASTSTGHQQNSVNAEHSAPPQSDENSRRDASASASSLTDCASRGEVVAFSDQSALPDFQSVNKGR